MDLSMVLSELQVNYPLLISRFSGNEALLLKFLLKFPQDRNFRQLREAVESGNHLAVEEAAHTLKGLGANLGFVRFSKANAEMVVAVREKRYETLHTLFASVEAEYAAVLRCLEKISRDNG